MRTGLAIRKKEGENSQKGKNWGEDRMIICGGASGSENAFNSLYLNRGEKRGNSRL